MSKTVIHTVRIEFGDCDPAGIVFFPNYSRWMDASSLNFFRHNGIPPWRDLTETRGIIGTPVLEINTRFMKSGTYGDVIEVHTSIEEWRAKTFTHRHVVRRGDDVLCEGTEVRAFLTKDPETGRLRAMPIPDDIRAACS